VLSWELEVAKAERVGATDIPDVQPGERGGWVVRLVLWSVTAAWAGLIFYLSTGTFGSAFSHLLLERLLALVHWHPSLQVFEALHWLMRKLAHLTEYGVFGLLLYGSLTGQRRFTWGFRSALLTLVLVALSSFSDEYHQSFVPGRHASLADCGIDIVGGALGMLGLFLQEAARQDRRSA